MKGHFFHFLIFSLIIFSTNGAGGMYFQSEIQDIVFRDKFIGNAKQSGNCNLREAVLTASSNNLVDNCPTISDMETINLRKGILAHEGELHPIYLPIVVNPPLVEQVVTSAGDAQGYPGYVWLNGYVKSVVSKPVFSVSIEVEFLHYPYCDPPEPCEPYKESEIVHPAFPATLPGQINPFLWEFMYAKDYASVVQVKVHSASLKNDSGKTYYPLTVLSWHREDKTVTGRVRNDSGKNLGDSRVVVFPIQCDVDVFYISNICRYREATLTNIGLQPGQEADFRVDYFYYEGNDVVVIGQGSTSP